MCVCVCVCVCVCKCMCLCMCVCICIIKLYALYIFSVILFLCVYKDLALAVFLLYAILFQTFFLGIWLQTL